MPFPSVTLCGAKKRDGSRCAQPGMANGRCRIHGGLTPCGIGAGRFKHGKYSRSLPARLCESYEEAMANPERHRLREESALLNARVHDLLARVDSGECGELWDRLRDTYEKAEAARGASDVLEGVRHCDKAAGAFFDLWDTLGAIITDGHADYRAWHEVTAVIEARRKIADTEMRRDVADRRTLTPEQALAFAGALAASVNKHVLDREVRAAISDDLRRLSNVEENRSLIGA